MNHGLITHGKSLSDVRNGLDEIVRVLGTILSRETMSPADLSYDATRSHSDAVQMLFEKRLERLLDRHSFPDSAVYCPKGYFNGSVNLLPSGVIEVPNDAKNPNALREISHASAYIALTAHMLGGLTYLSDNEVENINLMASEAYRRTV
jgi:hypothetical protein